MAARKNITWAEFDEYNSEMESALEWLAEKIYESVNSNGCRVCPLYGEKSYLCRYDRGCFCVQRIVKEAKRTAFRR